MTDPADLSAYELLAAYGQKALSPVEALRAVMARIEACEPKLEALFACEPERAMAEARASEARWQRGEACALDGVPATVKDNIATRGTPMPLGTAARAHEPPPATDAPAAARLREAGAVIFAKTTMPDYGMLSSGLSSFHPLTRNPWDTTKGPGGSSAGAGAAAAVGYGPLHVGTDIGGSVRLPAAWCGVFGLKPSFGRVPVDPPYWGRVAGPITRTVADSALLMKELARPDERDAMSLPPADFAWGELALVPRGLRLGLLTDIGAGLTPDPEIVRAVEDAAFAFEGAGAIVEPVRPFMTQAMIDGLDVFWRQRALLDLDALSPDKRERVLPYIRDWAEGARGLSGERVFAGLSQMNEMRFAALKACRGFDFVLMPVAPTVAFAAELPSPLNDPARPFEHIAFTVPFNFSEQPAASINAGFSQAGLPIALQIVGRRFDDLGVLRLAAAFEGLRGPQRPWPLP